MPRQTPLYHLHQSLGARCIDFGGWDMPVQYSGLAGEHKSVRTAAGMFDISHMGQLWVGGAKARDFLNYALTNEVSNLEVGDAQYTLMCRDNGGVVDDLYLYRIAAEAYLLIVNASRIEADLHWLEFQRSSRNESRTVKIEDQSSTTGAIAVQGPKVSSFINQLFDGEGLIRAPHPVALSKNQIDVFFYKGREVFVATSGYTGEDGYEIIAPNDILVPLWTRLLEIGQPHGLIPAGLGARDSLRTEMGYPLYGHELNEETTPLEAGLGFFVKFDKENFCGKSIIQKQKEDGVEWVSRAFKMNQAGPPPREGCEMLVNEKELIREDVWSWGPDGLKRQVDEALIGTVTSGTHSPMLECGIGLARVRAHRAEIGTVVDIDIRGKRHSATLCAKPLYKRQ